MIVRNSRLFMFDIAIIGAGIIGCQLAYELSAFDLSVVILEKNNEVLNEITSSNSGIIHAGYDPEDGTLKAKLNLLGASLYKEQARKLHVAYDQVGSLVVAIHEEELDILKELKSKAEKRSIIHSWLTQEEVRVREPHISDKVIAALYFPTTAIILPWEMGYALIDHACVNGVELIRKAEVISVEHHDGSITLNTKAGLIEARCVINCSGLKGEVVARLNRPDYPKSLVFKKGQYHVTDKNDADYINHVVYPVPSNKGKGILAVKTVEGNLLIGPTSELTENPYDFSTTQIGLSDIEAKIGNIIQPLPKTHMIRQFAGMRPSPIKKDFIIEEDTPDWINVIGIESPGLASAPGIASYVLETFIRPKFQLQAKENIVWLEPSCNIHDESPDAWNLRIRENPFYGKIVCICERVSEQEVIDAIRKPAGACSIKGVKRRVRPGSGRCQGGFCENRVVAILAKELGIKPEDVVYDDTPFLHAVGEER